MERKYEISQNIRRSDFGRESWQTSFINLVLTLIRESSEDGVDETSDMEWKFEVRRTKRQNVCAGINHNGGWESRDL